LLVSAAGIEPEAFRRREAAVAAGSLLPKSSAVLAKDLSGKPVSG